MRRRVCACRCGRCCTPSLRALWTTFLLNTVFTLAQIGGATAANSLALMGDTGTMAIDSATYAVNIAAEYYKARLGARRSALVEVAASGVSVLALLGVTAFVFYDAIARISALDDDQEVDPIIMLAFTCVNLLVDFGMCASFLLRKTGGLAGCLPSYCPGCLGVSDRREPNSTAPARVAMGGKGGAGMDAARGGPPRLGAHGPNTRAHSSVAGSKGSQLTRQGGGGGVSGGDGTGGSDGGGSDADGSGGDAGGGGGDGGDGDGSGGLEPAAGRCELRVPRLRSGRSLGRREPPRTPGSAPSRMRYARIGAAVDGGDGGGDGGGDAAAAAAASAADGLVGRRRRRRRSDGSRGENEPEDEDEEEDEEEDEDQAASAAAGAVQDADGKGSHAGSVAGTAAPPVASEENGQRAGGNAGDGSSPPGGTGLVAGELELALDLSASADLNLCSAFAHVLADTMRTLTVMACALLVWLGGLDSETTDAVGSLVVCAVILCVAGYVAVETTRQLRRLMREPLELPGVVEEEEEA